MWRIWSHAKQKWWRPGGSGSTAEMAEAGVFTDEQALVALRFASKGWHPVENAYPLDVVLVPVMAVEDETVELPAIAPEEGPSSGNVPHTE